MQKSALLISSLVFTLVAIAHFVRYALGCEIIIGDYHLSLQTSLVAGIATGVLALWNFLGSRRT